MEDKQLKSVLKTGTVFSAKNKLNEVYDYEFVGFDLSNVTNGIGCSYIVLRNLTTMNSLVCVEAAWFHERTITIKEANKNG